MSDWPKFDDQVTYQVWRFSACGRDLVIEGDHAVCESLRDDLRAAEEGSRKMARNFRQPRLDLSYELVERRTTRTIMPDSSNVQDSTLHGAHKAVNMADSEARSDRE